MTHIVTLCSGCALGRSGFDRVLAETLPAWQVQMVDCMSGCARPSTVAFRATGKTAYLFGDITAADLPEIAGFADAYAVSKDGTFADARILGGLRMKAIARIPG